MTTFLTSTWLRDLVSALLTGTMQALVVLACIAGAVAYVQPHQEREIVLAVAVAVLIVATPAVLGALLLAGRAAAWRRVIGR